MIFFRVCQRWFLGSNLQLGQRAGSMDSWRWRSEIWGDAPGGWCAGMVAARKIRTPWHHGASLRIVKHKIFGAWFLASFKTWAFCLRRKRDDKLISMSYLKGTCTSLSTAFICPSLQHVDQMRVWAMLNLRRRSHLPVPWSLEAQGKA